MRKLVLGLAAILTVFAGIAGVSRCLREAPVVVENDLAHPVALVCGELGGPGADPKFVSDGSNVMVHPYGSCMVYGPSALGVLDREGPYLGCLLMPDEAERADKPVVQASSVQRDMTFDACVDAR